MCGHGLAPRLVGADLDLARAKAQRVAGDGVIGAELDRAFVDELGKVIDPQAPKCEQPPRRVLGPVDDGKRALVRAPGFTQLCDALALPEVDAAHGIGRLRVDVDPRRV